ncbi:MAG: RNA methyltransferase [Bradyrhizobiaceae bacterium]|nr:MAG: RNA methyltransferase [Bradyrhizobiaceae bacterium]
MIRSARRLEKIRRVLARRQPGLTVVLENIHDPHNVSAVLRTCDAVGVLQAELLYTVERFPRIGKKSSSSANKWIERRKHTSVESCVGLLKSEGFTVLATRCGGNARPLYEVDLTLRTAFVLGNEHRGVSEEALSAADAQVEIPMMGMIESLNVSVAAAVCLYEALRQRLAAGMLAAPQLAEEDLRSLEEAWIER